MAKKELSQKDKEFQKVRRFVVKRAPGAHTIRRNDESYLVVDNEGRSAVNPELMIPPAKTVREAWQQAKYSLWFTNMMVKNTNAFSDEKIYKKLIKERGGDD
jgi:hypothetical protein